MSREELAALYAGRGPYEALVAERDALLLLVVEAVGSHVSPMSPKARGGCRMASDYVERVRVTIGAPPVEEPARVPPVPPPPPVRTAIAADDADERRVALARIASALAEAAR